MNIYPSHLAEQLDFNYILALLDKYCYGKRAKQLVHALKPSSSFDLVKQRLMETNEFLLTLHQGDLIPTGQYPELDNELHLLTIQNAVLNNLQFVMLRQLITATHELLTFFEDKEDVFPYLKNKLKHLEKDEFMLSAINQIIDKDGLVKDEASPWLQSLRKDMQENRKTSDRLYRIHIQKYKKLGFLADFEENFVNGRRVLCILAEHKREVKGIILSQSASGKISFIEPQNVIELNNDRKQLEEDEQKEIHRILKELTALLHPFHAVLVGYYDTLIAFDFIAAKAKLGRELKATLPIISKQNTHLHLFNAFHPVLLLQNTERHLPTVPIQCSLHTSERIMVISGPNAGGKSITLKTLGLLQIMLQCGLLIPAAAKSEMSIKKNLFGDIGDNQSIEDGLSTYSSRLLKMKYFLEKTDKDTLFLIDEFGTGSDPDMGGAMAEVILNKLNETKAQGVVTTHFTNLKLLANQKDGIFNACMLFNSKTLKPLYQLHIGEPGSSFTFEVAEKIGLPKAIIDDAKSILSDEKISMDKLLNQLQLEKNNIVKLKRDLQKQMSKTTAEKREFKDLNEKMETDLERSKEQKEERQKMMDYGKKLHQLTQEWLETKNKKEVIQKFVKLAGYEYAKKKLQEELEKTETFKQEKIKSIKTKIKIGSPVHMMKSREIGIIKTIEQNRAKVLFGNVEVNVSMDKLEIAKEKEMLHVKNTNNGEKKQQKQKS